MDSDKAVVMDYIHGYYKEAINRLPPSLISLVDEAGFCFGFLDPVSNIIANTAAYERSSPPVNGEGQGRRGKKRTRSQASTSGKEKGKRTDSKSEEAMRQGGKAISAEGSSIAARSLQGLFTFLTTYFRYLQTSEALRYLRLAKADLLIAVRLIEEDRDMVGFTIHQPTSKIALTCAALSAIRPKVSRGARPAKDPKVTGLVFSSLSLASRLDEVSPLLAIQGRLSTSTVRRLSEISMDGMHGTANPREPMRHAALRFPPSTKKMPFPLDLELALMAVLLDRIHGFYLKAISCIPAPCLRSLHHRGLLKAGHCYGPFNPVTNIILNTIWYDTAFPPQKEFKVDMISDESLARTECRSLHGLITFATTLFPALSRYDATRYLLVDNARLDSVIMRAKREGYQTSIPPCEAYKAAARVAKHPNPTALANLATGLFIEKGERLKSLLEAKHTLSPDDVRSISTSLSQNNPPSKLVGLVQELNVRASRIVSAKREDFEARQFSICKMVEGALKKHANDGGEEHELLFICGVNTHIPNDGKFGDFDNYDGYPYSHINIWARLKGSQLADAAPILLFIQCRNDTEDMKDAKFMCLPVSESSKDAGRCLHCEYDGTKIVHPLSSHTYLGQSFDFEDMAGGKYPVTNGELVEHGELKTIFVDTSEDDCTYFDPAWDADFAARLNRDAKREAEGEDANSARAKANMLKEMLRKMVAFRDSE